jgi:hypothetical protein
MTLTIVSRATWGARYDAGDGPAPLPASEVWLHHSATVAPDLAPPYDDEDAAVRLLEKIGEERFGHGISYTFAVMPTGRVYEGHGIARRGTHTAKRNSIARGIVLVGNYDEGRVPAPMIEGAAQLLVHGWRSGWWTTPRLNGGHQQAPGAATACPGRYGMAAVLTINNRAAELAAGAPTTTHPEDDDMPITDDDAKKIASFVWGRHILAAAKGPNGLIGPAGAGDFLRHAAAAATAAALQKPADVDLDADDVEALAEHLAPKLAAFVERSAARIPTDDLQAIAAGVVGELTRRLSTTTAPAPAATVQHFAAAAAIPEPAPAVDDELSAGAHAFFDAEATDGRASAWALPS